MHFSRIPGERLTTKRLDADFYRPEYLFIESKLMSLHPCSLGQSGRFFAGPFGSKLPSNLYLNEGVPLFRVGNVGQFEALTDNLAHLDESVHEKLRVSEVVPGDLLIVKASVGEKICKVPAWMPRANITQHIIAIRPNGRFDVDYLSAFLFGCYGRKQLQRYSLGSIIQYLGINDARSVLIPNIGPLAQEYIGNNVRQAERLRAWGKKLASILVTIVETAESEHALATKPKIAGRILPKTLTPRLDAKYYGNRSLEVLSVAQRAKHTIESLAQSVSNGFEERVFCSEGVPYVTVSEVCSGRLNLSSAPRIHSGVEIPGKARINGHCVLVVRTGSIGTAVKVDERDNIAVISSHFIRLEFDSQATASAVAAFLSSPSGKVLQHKISYGAVQPQIGQDELVRLPVPDHVLENGEKILHLTRSREDCIRSSDSLTHTAKLLVEALIEGEITEPQLIAAQKALDAGDDSLDRAILARLKTDGLDGVGEPLFPDLDQLYDLLERAQAEAEA